MITDRDKERIRAEEIFRDEVRKKLDENKEASFGKRSWKFINSSFGIWLLSTVLVGLVVSFYNNKKLESEISANNAATIQKLETEASNRLQQFKSGLSSQNPASLNYQKQELAYMIDGVLISDNSFAPKKPIYIFPEYKERTMNSLLYEIGRLTTDKTQVEAITKARTVLASIQKDLLNTEDPPRPDFSLSQRVQQIAQAQPENLSPDDRKQLAEYQEKERNFEKSTLAEYHKKIRKKLAGLLDLFESSAFLKEMSEK